MKFGRAFVACLVCGGALGGASPSAALSLEDALRLTRAQSPELRSLAASARATSARRVDAGRLSNPELSLEVENLGVSDRVETSATLSQPLGIGGGRAPRRDAADALARQASHELSAAERVALAETAERYVDLWAQQEQSALQKREAVVAAQVVDAARERFRIGAAADVERVRAESQLALRTAEAGRTAADLAAAKRVLALQWGGDPGVDSVSLGLPDVRAVPSADSLLALLDSHPDQLAAAAAVAVEEAHIREARAMRTPDIALQGGFKRLDEVRGTGAIAGVSITLPLWSRGTGAEAAAIAEREAAVSRRDAGKALLAVEIRNARERLAAAADVLASTRDQVVPGAHQALATITDAYRMGRSSYQEIADAQRALLEAESAALNARAEVWRAQASLARLAGVPLTETTDGGGK